MSRLAKKPMTVRAGVEISTANGLLTVKGAKGTLSKNLPEGVAINIANNEANFSYSGSAETQEVLGSTVSHLKNMMNGVSDGYEEKLIVEGVGYKAEVKGNKIVMALGFSHPVEIEIPQGVAVKSEKNVVTINGIDKDVVSAFASFIRGQKKPEPYKGKGIRYHNEVIRRKQGKKAA